MKMIARIAASIMTLLLLLPVIPEGGERAQEVLAQNRPRARSQAPTSRKRTARAKVRRVQKPSTRASSGRNRRVARRRASARRLVLRPGGLIPRERVREIQLALIERGFLEGPPTGVYDARTVEAMKRFQAAEGIEVTGYPTAHALYRLGLHPASSSNGPTASPTHRSPPSS